MQLKATYGSLIADLGELADDLTTLGLGGLAAERDAYLDAARMVRDLRAVHTDD